MKIKGHKKTKIINGNVKGYIIIVLKGDENPLFHCFSLIVTAFCNLRRYDTKKDKMEFKIKSPYALRFGIVAGGEKGLVMK